MGVLEGEKPRALLGRKETAAQFLGCAGFSQGTDGGASVRIISVYLPFC